MLQGFLKYIEKEKLFTRNQKILLTVSGGRDSTALVYLFHEAGFRFGIAHCNFHLRGKESEEDEAFVKNLARKLSVSFFSRRFDLTRLTGEKGISVQMAARDLRYAWFEELREKEGYDLIATAHHLDDQIETFFINLLRSSGIGGFHGILPKQGKLIRPLLFSYRKEIDEYIRRNNITFREDSSNQELKYLRNRIRHELLPVFSSINPDFRKILTENISRVAEAEKIFEEAIEQKRGQLLQTDRGITTISISDLADLDPLPTYAYEILSPFGFNFAVVQDILRSLEDPSAKEFLSPTHWVVKDRKNIVIRPLSSREIVSPVAEYTLGAKSKFLRSPIRLSIKKVPRNKDFTIPTGKNFASFDLEKVEFPLILRKWQKGDSFHPFGKDQHKKVSDFFIDEKFSPLEKQNTWLLCSGTKILWIVGHRIDNRFRITPRTKEVLCIEWKP
jgi:tRNA(Ile)-lysidine synthase